MPAEEAAAATHARTSLEVVRARPVVPDVEVRLEFARVRLEAQLGL